MAESAKKSKKIISDGAETVAERFRAVGDATRLRILWYLRCQTLAADQTGQEDEISTGANVTDLCRAVTGSDKLTSTFSHHLKELRHADLIGVEKDGKNRWYYLMPGAVEMLGAALLGPAAPNLIVSTEKNRAKSRNFRKLRSLHLAPERKAWKAYREWSNRSAYEYQ
jgi:ArsR family transcriptional regulator, arsenate/arsenite/antimonite-responsive transcriptional repressor